MDVQIENAIGIAWDSQSDQNLKAQAFDFLNQLRADPQAWQVCLTIFTRSPKATEVVRFVSLEIVNNALSTHQIDSQSLHFLKDNLLEYTRRIYGGSGSQDALDSASLQNKLTQTLTLIFSYSYKNEWQTFFDDVLALTRTAGSSSMDNLTGTNLYLRVLASIHDEIADVLMSRSSEETKRNVELKDLIRARDVGKVAETWKEILVYWRDRNDTVVEMCLKVIGKWVSWIDISLVVNQESLGILLPFVGRAGPPGREDKVRDAAIDCFTEIVSKKMKSADKIEMILFLNLADIVLQLVGSPPLHDARNTPDYDNDLAEAVAKLANSAVYDIVKVLEDTTTDNTTRDRANQLLQTFIPLLLRFFADDFDEICSAVIPSLTDTLTFFRKSQPLSPNFTAALPPILNAIIAKMRYDESADWGNEDSQTDEAEFQELRKRLQVLQKSVAAVDEPLYIDIVSNVVGGTFQSLEQHGSNVDWRDLDLALHEMYLFGELALPNGGLNHKSAPSPVATERLVAMMKTMVGSGLATFSHPAIQLQYMEIIVRYCSFFEANGEFIPQVLEQFVQLVHHNHVRVRTRSWYLFGRFVKHLRALLDNVAQTVIESISDLLPIKAEVQNTEEGDDMSSDQSDHSADAVFTSQLNLFEAVGCISSTATTPVEKQVLYARTIMNPLFSDIERNLGAASNGDAQAILQIHHIIMALGTLAYGYSDVAPGTPSSANRPPIPEIAAEFTRASEAILIALESLKSSFDVRTAARMAFSRLVGVIGVGILPSLPRWIDGLLSQSSSKDEMGMFLRLLDQVVFGFKAEIYNVLDSLLTPLLQRVFAGLAEPTAGTDDEIQLGELRREYLTFIQVILNNELGSVLVSEANQGFFEPLIHSVTTLAKSVSGPASDLPSSRLAFSVLLRMASLWGGPDVATPSSKTKSPTPSPTPTFPGFDTFLLERFHPICWEVLRDPAFKPAADAQAKQVLNEIAGLEQTIWCKTGDVFTNHLRSFFKSMGGDAEEYIKYMTTSKERRQFSQYMVQWMKQKG